MSSFSRCFAGSSDIQLVVDWVRAIRSSERVTDFPSSIDLPELLLLPQNQETTRLWFGNTGDLVGFAFVDAFHTLRFEIDWNCTTPELEAQIIPWGSDYLAKSAINDESSILYATAHEGDRLRQDYLNRQGFTCLADSILHLECSLTTTIAAPELPSEFTIRSVEGEHEAAKLAELHREAFGTSHMTIERRLVMMRTASYDPALDLVATTLDGMLVAYGTGTLSPEENILTGQNECYADLFATRPAYRGYGLARATLGRLLILFQERGFTTAKLNTSSENAPMLRVATSEGFRIVSKTFRFARPVSFNQPHGSTSVSNQEFSMDQQKSPLDSRGITSGTPITRDDILQSVQEGRRDYD